MGTVVGSSLLKTAKMFELKNGVGAEVLSLVGVAVSANAAMIFDMV